MLKREKMNSIDNEVNIEEELDLKEMWRVFHSYRKSIALIFIVVILITAFITITTQPEFQATTIVMVKKSATDPSSFVFDFGTTGSQQRLQNEIEVLNSYVLHDQVVQSLIKDDNADTLALFGTRYTRKRYRITNYVLEWIGRNTAIKISPEDLSFSQRIEIVEDFRESTAISAIRDADVIKISVTSSDSSDAVFLANRFSEIYRNIDLEGGQGELHFVLTFLDSQITQYEERLNAVENELRQFQAEHKIYSLDGSAALLLDDLTEYESIYYTNVAELEVSQQRVLYLRDKLSENEKNLIEESTNTSNPMILALREKIAELEAQKVQQMVDESWSEESLQAKDYSRRIFEMKSNLKNISESLILSAWSEEEPFAATQEIFNKIVEQEIEIHSAKSRAQEYKILVDNISERLNTLPDQTLQYARLERQLKLNENLYLTMKQKYEESRITEAGQMGKVRILDPALIAEKVKPNKKLNLLLGLIIGIALGVGYAFAKEFLDNTVKAVEQLEKKGLTVLGIIPDMHHKQGSNNLRLAQKPSEGGTDFRRRLITYEDPKSPISESYRSLRTNITYASADKKIRSILVSSPQPGEGKSTTVANLAIAFAQLRKRTLLVDADLRKPVQHNVFGQQRGPGLSEYLIGDIADFNSIVKPTKVEYLSVVSAGGLPPNPSELLGSDRMSNLVDTLEHEWDIVLFDSPPIVAVTDSSMISSEIDALVLVVKAGQTDRSAVDRALDTIRNVKSPLIGAILNGANPETLVGKYSYYYSYYNYYYHSDDDSKRA
jgi:capsular exopolysaccharide synthesis family protein